MRTVLLTGASGFVGQSAIRPLLAKNYIVHAVTSKPLDFEATENLFWHQANLLDRDETNALIESVRPTHLLHFAWKIEHGKHWMAKENFDWVNASLHLLERFIGGGGRRAVFAGTCFEYSLTDDIYSESASNIRPESIYGKCKAALQLLSAALAQHHNISFAWGRLFFTFGANDCRTRLIPYVIQNLLRNELTETSHANQIRDFLYVEDVADAFVELLDSEVSGEVNIASGVPVTLKEIIFKIADIIGNRDLIRLGAFPAPANEPPQIVADVERLRSEVGWKPKWSLDAGLAETVKWWRENI